MASSKLYLPGLAEYGDCKRAFLCGQELLSALELSKVDIDGHNQKELSGLLQILNTTPDAVDFLKAEFGPEYARVHEQLEKACLPEFHLDEHAANGGKKRLPNDWYDHWSNIHDGRVMASMGNLYNSFKLIKKMREHGTTQEQAIAQTYLSSLREDFDWPKMNNWLISSTRPIYLGKSLDARIVQHYRCNKSELIKETVMEVPVYRGVQIEKIVGEEKGLAYMQALFDTKDDGETIMQTLEFISGKHRKDIVGWTAAVSTSDSSYTRATHPERAAGFDCGDDRFHVDGSDVSLSPGCSRGVRGGGGA
ncbi:MAG: hypothetical protein Q8R53_03200 [Nanoarchaeota archaeon]|nr:hypothetical protein [Nanoarchaeota archaeon]